MSTDNRIPNITARTALRLFLLSLTLICLVRGLAYTVDSDPQLMLSSTASEASSMARTEFSLLDPLILGISNHTEPQGALSPGSLALAETLSRVARETLQDRLTPAAARTTLTPDRANRLTPEGFSRLTTTPLFSSAPSLASINADALLKDLLVSEDGHTLALTLPVETASQAADLVSALTSQLPADRSPGDRLTLTGYPLGRYLNANRLPWRLLSAVLIGIALSSSLGYMVYRRPKRGLLPLFSSLFAVSICIALLSLFPLPPPQVTITIPLTALAVSQLTSWSLLCTPANDRRRISASTMALTMALCLTGLLVPLPWIRLTALGNGLAVLLAWLGSQGFFALRPRHPPPPAPRLDPTGRSATLALQHRPPLLGLTALFLLLGLFGLARLGIDEPLPHPTLSLQAIDATPDDVAWLHTLSRPAGLLLSATTSPMNPAQATDWLRGQIEGSPELAPEYARQMETDIELAREQEKTGEIAALLRSRWSQTLNQLPLTDIAGHQAWSWALDLLVQLETADQVFLHPETLHQMEALQHRLTLSPLVHAPRSLATVARLINDTLAEPNAPSSLPATAGAIHQGIDAYTRLDTPFPTATLISRDYQQALIRFTLSDDRRLPLTTLRSLPESTSPPLALKQTWVGSPMINLAWLETLAGRNHWPIVLQAIILPAVLLLRLRHPIRALLALFCLALPLVTVLGSCGLFGQPLTAEKFLIIPLLQGIGLWSASSLLEPAHRPEHHESAVLWPLLFTGASLLPCALTLLSPLDRTGSLMAITLMAMALSLLLALPLGTSLLLADKQPQGPSGPPTPPDQPPILDSTPKPSPDPGQEGPPTLTPNPKETP